MWIEGNIRKSKEIDFYLIFCSEINKFIKNSIANYGIDIQCVCIILELKCNRIKILNKILFFSESKRDNK